MHIVLFHLPVRDATLLWKPMLMCEGCTWTLGNQKFRQRPTCRWQSRLTFFRKCQSLVLKASQRTRMWVVVLLAYLVLSLYPSMPKAESRTMVLNCASPLPASVSKCCDWILGKGGVDASVSAHSFWNSPSCVPFNGLEVEVAFLREIHCKCWIHFGCICSQAFHSTAWSATTLAWSESAAVGGTETWH